MWLQSIINIFAIIRQHPAWTMTTKKMRDLWNKWNSYDSSYKYFREWNRFALSCAIAVFPLSKIQMNSYYTPWTEVSASITKRIVVSREFMITMPKSVSISNWRLNTRTHILRRNDNVWKCIEGFNLKQFSIRSRRKNSSGSVKIAKKYEEE